MKKIPTQTNKGIVCSICIANFNGLKFIDQCINSVLNQKGNLNFEIIVHDDASTDESVKHIRKKFPSVRLIESKKNVGFCVGNNRMVECARGEYILLLNNDAALFDDALTTFYKYSQKKGHTQSILGLPQYNAATGELIDIGSNLDPFLNAVPNLKYKSNDVGMIIGACLWIQKSLWNKLGGFPEWFHTLAEDMYLCCLARLKGYSVKAIPTSGFSHWVGRSIGGGKIIKKRLSSSINRRKLSELNKTYVMILCFPKPVFQLIFPAHILLLTLEGIALSIIKKDINIFKAIYLNLIKSLWKNKKALVVARKESQSSKKITVIKFLKVFMFMPYKLKMLIRFGIPKLLI